MPMLDMGSPPSEIKRSGNQHRQFIPVNVYETADGFIYIAVGSDPQWSRFTKMPMFDELNQECYSTNEGRRKHQEDLFEKIGAITIKYPSSEISMVLAEAAIPHSPITPIEEVPDLSFVAETALKTFTPDGQPIRLPPPAQPTEHLKKLGGELPFAPAYGENTDALLEEIGLSSKKIASLKEQGVVA
jgi:itaconate CoA-transferase